jgi:hypothetical protein
MAFLRDPCDFGTPSGPVPGDATTDRLPPHSLASFSMALTRDPIAIGTPSGPVPGDATTDRLQGCGEHVSLDVAYQ